MLIRLQDRALIDFNSTSKKLITAKTQKGAKTN